MAGLSISSAFLSRQYKGSKSKDTFLIRTVRFQAIQAILGPFLSCKNKGEKEKKRSLFLSQGHLFKRVNLIGAFYLSTGVLVSSGITGSTWVRWLQLAVKHKHTLLMVLGIMKLKCEIGGDRADEPCISQYVLAIL